MTRPMVRIHNIETDELIDREMTDAEFATYQADQLAMATVESERLEADQIVLDAKASRDAKLEKMGFTADEIANW